MARVLLLRLAAAAPLLLGVSFLSFVLLSLAPGSFVDRLRLDPRLSPATLAAMESRFGLDAPWPTRYALWLTGAVRGDLGFSLAFQRPVRSLLLDGGLYTLALLAGGAALAWATGLLLGIAAARRPGAWLDRVISGAALGALSLPTLVLAVLALGLAAATGALPVGGASSPSVMAGSAGADFFRHLVLPALVLAANVGPLLTLQVRGALVEVWPADFVRAARSRGLPGRTILLGHVLRAALVPLAALVGGSLSRLLNGALLVEVVTGWPGLGRLALEGLVARDSFLLLGVLTVSAGFVWLGNLTSDVLVAAVHPRVRLEEAGP